MDIQEQTIQERPEIGATTITNTSQTIPNKAEVQERQAYKGNQIVWYIIGLLNALLALRLVFLLLGAGRTGFTLFLYNLTEPFVMPFSGIFPTPAVQGSYFDTAALVAIIVYTLAGFAIAGLINLSRRSATPTV